MSDTKTDKTPRPRRKRRLRRWLVIGGVLMLVMMAATIEVTSRSRFCGTCHIMRPFYASWHDSAHADVKCVECHIPPGGQNYLSAKLNGLGQVVDDWLNRTSTKPSASVSDLSCMRAGCHVVEEIDTSSNPDRPYFFDHGRHLGRTYRGIAIHCSTCHSHVKGDQHFEVNTNSCIACHLQDRGPSDDLFEVAAVASGTHEPAATTHDATAAAPDAAGAVLANMSGPAPLTAPSDCLSCHSPPLEPFERHGLVIDHREYLEYGSSCESCHRGVTERSPPITDAQCLSCHVFGMERVLPVEEMHTVHTEGKHKIECFSCHGLIHHGPSAQIMSLGEFDCRTCHQDQHVTQRGQYLNGNGSPHEAATTAINPMFLVHVDCNACHIKPRPVSAKPTSGASVAVAVPEACDACHRPGLGQSMVKLWQETTHTLYDEVESILPGPEDDWSAGRDDLRRDLDEARRLLETVRIDGSWGVHNPQYTQILIERARELAVRARDAAKPAAEPTP